MDVFVIKVFGGHFHGLPARVVPMEFVGVDGSWVDSCLSIDVDAVPQNVAETFERMFFKPVVGEPQLEFDDFVEVFPMFLQRFGLRMLVHEFFVVVG